MQPNISTTSIISLPKRLSLKYCLKQLGADSSEVDKNALLVLSYDEILSWAKHLYRNKVIQFHPDKNGDDKYCQHLSCMYNQIIKIIDQRQGKSLGLSFNAAKQIKEARKLLSKSPKKPKSPRYDENRRYYLKHRDRILKKRNEKNSRNTASLLSGYIGRSKKAL
jgi:hypothetical protein